MHETPDAHSPRTRRQLHEAGWSDGRIARAIADGTLERLAASTYRAAGTTADEQLTRARAARAHFGADLVLVLGTAARVHGLPEPWPNDGATHIALPPGREQHQRAGFSIHTWVIASEEITVVNGLRVTTIARTLRDLMCTVDRLSAVSAVDAALHTGSVTADDVRELARTTRRRRGAARSRLWWSEADGRAESPLETRVRLRAVDGGYPPSDLQHEFVVRGRLYRTDLVWTTAAGRLVVGEADGLSFHDVPEALLHDRRRSNDLVSTGRIDLIRFVWADSVPVHQVPATLSRFLGPPRAA